ncbi:MAG: hypothetical protein JW966_14065 [Anaerolineae bacterium]|nr:hypothetical protein [Anaerolineae bacterium]
MAKSRFRPMQRADWVPVVTDLVNAAGKFSQGFVRADGQRGNALLKTTGHDDVETRLNAAYAVLRACYPAITVARYHARMPFWHGEHTPTPADYRLVGAPQALTTTAITVILVPQAAINSATLGFHFQGATLPPLRERMQRVDFQGLVGNLGYYMTADLIRDKFRWSHNTRYPAYPLPEIPSYIGFHWRAEPDTGAVYGAFESAHPSAVAIRANGTIDILHRIDIDSYNVRFGARELTINAINTPDAAGEDVVVFTPALRTAEVEHYITAQERTRAVDNLWHTYAPTIPLADAADRIHVFVANTSEQHIPQERVIAVWDGAAPLPSFGAVVSFKRAYFEVLFGSVPAFKITHLNQPVQIVPVGTFDFDRYQHIMGGLIPAVMDACSLYLADTVTDVLRNLNQFGNATSPIAQMGRETRNFDPYQREPAGLLIQTAHHIGWVLFDGRHELSIGASVIDAAMLLKKLEMGGCLGGETVQQALFMDGGSAMKVYNVSSDRVQTTLEPLNRIAAGARNGPSLDYEGLNLYSTLALALDTPPER